MNPMGPKPLPNLEAMVTEARSLGFESDPSSVAILGTGWPVLVALPWLSSNTRSRLLIVGQDKSAMLATDYAREHPVRVLWSGDTTRLDWRRFRRWFGRVDSPYGDRFYADARWERRKLEEVARRTA